MFFMFNYFGWITTCDNTNRQNFSNNGTWGNNSIMAHCNTRVNDDPTINPDVISKKSAGHTPYQRCVQMDNINVKVHTIFQTQPSTMCLSQLSICNPEGTARGW